MYGPLLRKSDFWWMDAVNLKMTELLRKVLEGKGAMCSKSADDLMPFDRPTPEQAMQSGHKIRLASVALPLFRRENEWCISLMKRTEYPGVHSGQISIPGGEVERQDRSRLETAIREFREEMGVDLQPESLVSGLSERYIPPSKFAVSTYIAVLSEEPKWQIDSQEVAGVLTIPVSELLKEGALRATPIEIQTGVLVSLPAYHWQGEVIWGATAIILTEFAMVWSEMKALL